MAARAEESLPVRAAMRGGGYSDLGARARHWSAWDTCTTLLRF